MEFHFLRPSWQVVTTLPDFDQFPYVKVESNYITSPLAVYLDARAVLGNNRFPIPFNHDTALLNASRSKSRPI